MLKIYRITLGKYKTSAHGIIFSKKMYIHVTRMITYEETLLI